MEWQYNFRTNNETRTHTYTRLRPPPIASLEYICILHLVIRTVREKTKAKKTAKNQSTLSVSVLLCVIQGRRCIIPHLHHHRHYHRHRPRHHLPPDPRRRCRPFAIGRRASPTRALSVYTRLLFFFSTARLFISKKWSGGRCGEKRELDARQPHG